MCSCVHVYILIITISDCVNFFWPYYMNRFFKYLKDNISFAGMLILYILGSCKSIVLIVFYWIMSYFELSIKKIQYVNSNLTNIHPESFIIFFFWEVFAPRKDWIIFLSWILQCSVFLIIKLLMVLRLWTVNSYDVKKKIHIALSQKMYTPQNKCVHTKGLHANIEMSAKTGRIHQNIDCL